MQFTTICPEYIEYAIRFGRVALILTLGLIGIYFIRNIIKRQLLKVYPDALRVSVIIRLISYLLFFLVATIVLQEFGINMTALIGAAGVVGVAIGFAAQTSVANVISGLFLTMEHPFEINDMVVINGIDGKIKALNLFAVTICTYDNKIVRIPNEQVLKSNITNISKNNNRRFENDIDLAPETNINHAIDCIKQVAKNSHYLVQEPAPFIAVKEITGNYSRLFVAVWTTQQQWGTTRATFLAEIKNAFEQNGIKLAQQICISK